MYFSLKFQDSFLYGISTRKHNFSVVIPYLLDLFCQLSASQLVFKLLTISFLLLTRACGFEKPSCSLCIETLIRFRFGYFSRATPPLFNFCSIGSIDNQSMLNGAAKLVCLLNLKRCLIPNRQLPCHT